VRSAVCKDKWAEKTQNLRRKVGIFWAKPSKKLRTLAAGKDRQNDFCQSKLSDAVSQKGLSHWNPFESRIYFITRI
jgi:hypothetical protein